MVERDFPKVEAAGSCPVSRSEVTGADCLPADHQTRRDAAGERSAVSAEPPVPQRFIRRPAIQSRDPLTLVPGGPAMPWPPSGDQFSAESKRAFSLAQDEAVRLAHNHVGPVHLFVGIACAAEGLGHALGEIGITPQASRDALAAMMGSGETPMPPGEITLIPHTQRVLDIAIGRSRQRGAPSAGSEDLLLGLIDEGEHFTTKLLRAIGVAPDAVRRTALEWIDRGRPGA